MGVVKNFTVNRRCVFNAHQIYFDGTFVYRAKTYAFQATAGFYSGDKLWKNMQLEITNYEDGPEMTAASQKICRPELIETTTTEIARWHCIQKSEFNRLLQLTMDENKAKHEQFIADLKAVIKYSEDELAAGYTNNILEPYPKFIGMRHQMWQIDRDNHLGIVS
jgi:hypothetical protein